MESNLYPNFSHLVCAKSLKPTEVGISAITSSPVLSTTTNTLSKLESVRDQSLRNIGYRIVTIRVPVLNRQDCSISLRGSDPLSWDTDCKLTQEGSYLVHILQVPTKTRELECKVILNTPYGLKWQEGGNNQVDLSKHGFFPEITFPSVDISPMHSVTIPSFEVKTLSDITPERSESLLALGYRIATVITRYVADMYHYEIFLHGSYPLHWCEDRTKPGKDNSYTFTYTFKVPRGVNEFECKLRMETSIGEQWQKGNSSKVNLSGSGFLVEVALPEVTFEPARLIRDKSFR